MLLGKSFRIQERLKTQSGEASSSDEELPSLTAFLNTLESERIFPTTVGNFAVRNPYSKSIIYCKTSTTMITYQSILHAYVRTYIHTYEYQIVRINTNIIQYIHIMCIN